MKKAELGDVFEFEGQIVEVKWINSGQRSIGFMPVNAKPCPCCGETKSWDIIEISPLFQDNVKPVSTIKGM
jgi:hypothetical protein